MMVIVKHNHAWIKVDIKKCAYEKDIDADIEPEHENYGSSQTPVIRIMICSFYIKGKYPGKTIPYHSREYRSGHLTYGASLSTASQKAGSARTAFPKSRVSTRLFSIRYLASSGSYIPLTHDTGTLPLKCSWNLTPISQMRLYGLPSSLTKIAYAISLKNKRYMAFQASLRPYTFIFQTTYVVLYSIVRVSLARYRSHAHTHSWAACWHWRYWLLDCSYSCLCCEEA